MGTEALLSFKGRCVYILLPKIQVVYNDVFPIHTRTEQEKIQ